MSPQEPATASEDSLIECGGVPRAEDFAGAHPVVIDVFPPEHQDLAHEWRPRLLVACEDHRVVLRRHAEREGLLAQSRPAERVGVVDPVLDPIPNSLDSFLVLL